METDDDEQPAAFFEEFIEIDHDFEQVETELSKRFWEPNCV